MEEEGPKPSNVVSLEEAVKDKEIDSSWNL